MEFRDLCRAMGDTKSVKVSEEYLRNNYDTRRAERFIDTEWTIQAIGGGGAELDNEREGVTISDVDFEYIEAIPKQATNDSMLQELLDSLHPIEGAILRERILTILQLSVKEWEENPEGWDNPFYGISYMKALRNKAERIMGFEKDENWKAKEV